MSTLMGAWVPLGLMPGEPWALPRGLRVAEPLSPITKIHHPAISSLSILAF